MTSYEIATRIYDQNGRMTERGTGKIVVGTLEAVKICKQMTDENRLGKGEFAGQGCTFTMIELV